MQIHAVSELDTLSSSGSGYSTYLSATTYVEVSKRIDVTGSEKYDSVKFNFSTFYNDVFKMLSSLNNSINNLTLSCSTIALNITELSSKDTKYIADISSLSLSLSSLSSGIEDGKITAKTALKLVDEDGQALSVGSENKSIYFKGGIPTVTSLDPSTTEKAIYAKYLVSDIKNPDTTKIDAGAPNMAIYFKNGQPLRTNNVLDISITGNSDSCNSANTAKWA